MKRLFLVAAINAAILPAHAEFLGQPEFAFNLGSKAQALTFKWTNDHKAQDHFSFGSEFTAGRVLDSAQYTEHGDLTHPVTDEVIGVFDIDADANLKTTFVDALGTVNWQPKDGNLRVYTKFGLTYVETKLDGVGRGRARYITGDIVHHAETLRDKRNGYGFAYGIGASYQVDDFTIGLDWTARNVDFEKSKYEKLLPTRYDKDTIFLRIGYLL